MTKRSDIIRHCPQFVLILKTRHDLPSRINEVPFQRNDNVEIPVYWAHKKGKRFDYWYYGLYHHYDPKARHRHDFEMTMMVYDKDDDFVCAVAVCHLNFKVFRHRVKPWVFVEAGGHGMTLYHVPIYAGGVRDLIVVPDYYTYISLQSNESRNQWPAWQVLFGKSVNMPDRFDDRQLCSWAKAHRKEMIENTGQAESKGLLWNNPDGLMWELERTERITL